MSKKYFANIAFVFVLSLFVASCSDAPQGEVASADNAQVLGRGEGKDNWWDQLPREEWQRFKKIEQQQEWFEVYQITDGIYAIYEMGQFEEVISYLILGEERALLFDTGIGVGDMKKLVSNLTDLPVSVLNSHTHYDHVGGNYAFDDVFGTATEFTANNALGQTNDQVREYVGPGWVWKPMPNGITVDNYQIRPFEITATINDGDKIDLGGRVLEVFLVPGHAPDALVVMDRNERLMFTGDTFYPATLYAHLTGSDVDDYTRTAARLAAMAKDVDILLPSHNEPWVSSDYLGAMQAAFIEIKKLGADYKIADGDREYHFDGFTIMVNDPPSWLK